MVNKVKITNHNFTRKEKEGKKLYRDNVSVISLKLRWHKSKVHSDKKMYIVNPGAITKKKNPTKYIMKNH